MDPRAPRRWSRGDPYPAFGDLEEALDGEAAAMHEQATPAGTRLTCEICRSDYQVAVVYRFALERARCMRWPSLGHAIEAVMLVLVLISCFVMFPIARAREKARKEREGGDASDEDGDDDRLQSILIDVVMPVLMVLLSLVAMHRVYLRWRRANSVFAIAPLDGVRTGGEVAPDEEVGLQVPM